MVSFHSTLVRQMGFRVDLSIYVRGNRGAVVCHTARRTTHGWQPQRAKGHDRNDWGALARYASHHLRVRDSGGYRKGLFPSECPAPNRCLCQILLSPRSNLKSKILNLKWGYFLTPVYSSTVLVVIVADV